MIREVECASVCNNSSPDDCSCLKFRLEDAKVHHVILHGSDICVSNRKRVLKTLRSFDTLLENCFDRQKLLEFEYMYIEMWSFGCLLASYNHVGHTASG